MIRSNIRKMFRKINNLSNKGMRGGANNYNSGINNTYDELNPANNDELKDFERRNEEMRERQEKAKKKGSTKKKEAGSRRRGRSRGKARGKRCTSKKLGGCGTPRSRITRRRSRR